MEVTSTVPSSLTSAAACWLVSNAYKNKSLIIILNNHHIFSNMPIEKFSKQLSKPAIIYDFWNHFDKNKLNLPDNIEYISLGAHYKNKNFI